MVLFYDLDLYFNDPSELKILNLDKKMRAVLRNKKKRVNYNFIFGGGRGDNQYEVRRERARGTVLLGGGIGLGVTGLEGMNLL